MRTDVTDGLAIRRRAATWRWVVSVVVAAGLLVALVARNHPLLAIPVAVFFGALRAGGGFLASTGVPRYLVTIVTALLVLAAVFPAAYAEIRRRRRPAPAVAGG